MPSVDDSSSDSKDDFHSAQVVETSVTNNSLSKDYPHPDGHAKQITDTSSNHQTSNHLPSYTEIEKTHCKRGTRSYLLS